MNTIHWSRGLLAALIICVGAAAHAKVYECRDRQGHHLYTEQPGSSHCQAVNVHTGTFSSVPTYAPPAQSAGTTSPSAPTKMAAGNNSSQIQAAQKQLDEARTALDEGKKVRYGNERNYAKYQERIKGLEDNVKQREQALQQLKQQKSSGDN